MTAARALKDEPDLFDEADVREHERLKPICAGFMNTRSPRGRERLRDYRKLTHRLLGAK